MSNSLIPRPIPNSATSFELSDEVRFDLDGLMYKTAIRLGNVEWVDGEWKGRPNQTLTEQNFWSAYGALREYLDDQDDQPALPTRDLLETWRNDMLRGDVTKPDGTRYSVNTINARLTHVRRLIDGMISAVQHPGMILLLSTWRGVKNAKKITKSDTVESDFGHRLTMEELADFLKQPDTKTLLGLRDRAILFLAAGAGLRISEIRNLNMTDVFNITDDAGQRGILIREGKHGKQRVVVLNSWNSWVITGVQRYVDALPTIYPLYNGDPVIRGVERVAGGTYADTGERLSTVTIGEAVRRYTALYRGQPLRLEPHDLGAPTPSCVGNPE